MANFGLSAYRPSIAEADNGAWTATPPPMSDLSLIRSSCLPC